MSLSLYARHGKLAVSALAASYSQILTLVLNPPDLANSPNLDRNPNPLAFFLPPLRTRALRTLLSTLCPASQPPQPRKA